MTYGFQIETLKTRFSLTEAQRLTTAPPMLGAEYKKNGKLLSQMIVS